MKVVILLIILYVLQINLASAQLKETAQLATLSPVVAVIYSDDIEGYHKNHYMISTITYMGSYMITDSIWKSAVISLAVGASKELIYDRLLDRGEPLWSDMKWNALGVAQGAVFTVSLKF